MGDMGRAGRRANVVWLEWCCGSGRQSSRASGRTSATRRGHACDRILGYRYEMREAMQVARSVSHDQMRSEINRTGGVESAGSPMLRNADEYERCTSEHVRIRAPMRLVPQLTSMIVCRYDVKCESARNRRVIVGGVESRTSVVVTASTFSSEV